MISAVGISVVDHIMIMDGFRTGEGSFHCERYYRRTGGMAATALCAASKLGSLTRLFSRVGDDPGGEVIRRDCAAFGVDTSGIINVPGRNSVVSFVMVDKNTGEKQFYSERVKSVFINPIELDTARLEGTAVLLVDGHWTDQALRAVMWAKNHSVPVVADFKRSYPGIDNLFPYIDYFIVPRFFAEEITGKSEVAAVLTALSDKQPGVPVITNGTYGGSYLTDGIVGHYPVFPVECVDSTGAGDAFHGAFCHFLSRGGRLDRCLELSSAVGAMNCRGIGGRESLPTSEELARFLESHGAAPDLP